MYLLTKDTQPTLKIQLASFFFQASFSEFLLQGMLAFRISKEVSWGRLFSVMETIKNEQRAADYADDEGTVKEPLLEDYAASDASLEQIFLSFAREATPNNTTDTNHVTYVTEL